VRARYLHAEDLVLDPYHPAAAVGEGLLRIIGTGRIIGAAALREDPDAKIITDDPETVCRVLGVEFPDVQVLREM
jgi:hypothetical protein